MRHQRSFGIRRGVVAFAAVLLALAVVAGAAKVGQAGTNPLTSTFTVLNDLSATVPGQPTPGGNIGYELVATNTSTSNVNHVRLSESIGSGGTIVYLNATGIPCTGMGTSTLSCSMPKLLPGAQIDVVVLFRTPAAATPGSDVTNTVVGSFDSQTPNSKNSRPTDTFGPTAPVVRQYAGLTDGSLSQSLTLPSDALTAGGGLTSIVAMPNGFLNKDFVGATVQNFTGDAAARPTDCTNCLNLKTKITIPTASTFSITGPFYDGDVSHTDAYSWTIKVASVPSSFKPVGIWHSENDDGSGGAYLLPCSPTSTTPPSAAPGLCISSVTLKKTDPNYLTYTGLGINNGSNWPG